MNRAQMVASLGSFRYQNRIFNLTAHNLSNAQTPGFKKDVSLFHAFLDERVDLQALVQEDGIKTQFQQGTVQPTGNALDLAIEGQGFFKVKTPQGIRYTRAGHLKMNSEKVLVDANGYPVLGRQKEISVKGQKIVIGKDGTVTVDGNEVDQLALVSFPSLDSLVKEGNSLFRLEEGVKESQVSDRQIIQGSLEMSNVNPVEEMVRMIDSLRTYESCLKLIQSQDEMDGKAANEIGRV